MRWLENVSNLVDMSFSKLEEIVKDMDAWSVTVHEVTKSRT